MKVTTTMICRSVLVGAMLFGLPGLAQATPFSSSLSVTGTSSFDTTNSAPPVGAATQTGNINLLAGGASQQSIFNGVSINPAALTSPLTDLGDGVGMHIDLAGDGTNGTAENPGVFGDLSLGLANTSATTTYTVTLRLGTSYVGLFAAGSDAFVLFDVSIKDAQQNELLFSHRLVDTVNPNETSDSASNTFDVLLNPGVNATFSGLVQGRAGAFASDSDYGGSVDTFFSIVNVTARDNPGPGPNPLPEPGMLALLGLGLTALSLFRRS